VNVKNFKNLEALVGHTPLLEITLKYRGEIRKVYAKAEYYNYTGSIKDRIAYYILGKAYEFNFIKASDIIAEATNGNTGISFAGIGRLLGHRVRIFMPEWMSEERKKIIKSYGADLRLVTKEEGGFEESTRLVEDKARQGGFFLPHQFSNVDNSAAHYHGTAKEIFAQIGKFADHVDGTAIGVGTGGTIMGLNDFFREKFSNFKSFPLEPDNAAIMSGFRDLKEHKIQGIGDGFIPELVKLEQLERPILVNEDDSIVVAQMLAKIFGIGVGISSGANFLGTLKAQDLIGKDKVIVTVFADDNKKYLSTDYSREIEIGDNFIAKDIELLDLRATR
jgi:cysteine synthase A